MKSHQSELFRAVFDHKLDDLVVTLNEAQEYLGCGEDLAAIGTLIVLDEQYADLQAALRLFRSSLREP